MKKRRFVLITILLVAVGGITAWRLTRLAEPVYQGKTLTQWLDAYNEVGSLEKTEPISDAIRAMGTNCLPFLLKNLKHRDYEIWLRFLGLTRNQRIFRSRFFAPNMLAYPSILALHVLGSNAVPLLPELQKLEEDPRTILRGSLGLLAIGTNSIPFLVMSCKSTNSGVRLGAATMLAWMEAPPPTGIIWEWYFPLPGRMAMTFRFVGPDAVVPELINMLQHTNAAVRRASANAIGSFAWTDMTRYPPAVPQLEASLNDSDAGVREAAREALLKIKPGATRSGN